MAKTSNKKEVVDQAKIQEDIFESLKKNEDKKGLTYNQLSISTGHSIYSLRSEIRFLQGKGVLGVEDIGSSKLVFLRGEK